MTYQVDLGNVAVAVVTLVVVATSFYMSNLSLAHAEMLQREKYRNEERKELLKEIADLIYELRAAVELTGEEAVRAHTSAVRRAEYLKLYLSPEDSSENAVRDLIHEATIAMSDRDRGALFLASSKLSAAARENFKSKNQMKEKE